MIRTINPTIFSEYIIIIPRARTQQQQISCGGGLAGDIIIYQAKIGSNLFVVEDRIRDEMRERERERERRCVTDIILVYTDKHNIA